MRIVLKQNLIPHKGELGTGREEVIRKFLRDHLPNRFRVSTGFVFDSNGGVSKQLDIIISDALICPQFEAVGGKLFYPCESVVAVGEVKTSLISKRDINKAFENLCSVKCLDRSSKGNNHTWPEFNEIDQKVNHLDQIFTFIFVIDQCVNEEFMRKELFEYLYNNERYLWPNICFFFDHYLMTYTCEMGVCPNPMDALAISVLENMPGEELLIKFYTMLSRAIEVTTVSKFAYWDYLRAEGNWEASSYRFIDAPIKNILPDHLVNRIKRM